MDRYGCPSINPVSDRMTTPEAGNCHVNTVSVQTGSSPAVRAGQRAAALMSLIQSARQNGHNPFTYLKDVQPLYR